LSSLKKQWKMKIHCFAQNFIANKISGNCFAWQKLFRKQNEIEIRILLNVLKCLLENQSKACVCCHWTNFQFSFKMSSRKNLRKLFRSTEVVSKLIRHWNPDIVTLLKSLTIEVKLLIITWNCWELTFFPKLLTVSCTM
jgi:hypothetical protein